MSYNFVVVGYGGMGHYHGDTAKAIDGLNFTGIYDIREEPKEDARNKGLHVYETLDELLNDKTVDLVTIATPNNYHHDLAVACLKSGKNVISEKPVMMNSAELEDVMRVSEETGKLFTIHHNRRWDGDYLLVKKVVEEGKIGQPYYIESRIGGSGRGMYGWRGFSVNGGGMLLDWGVHLLDQLLDLFDSPIVSVDAHLVNLYSPEVDDSAKVFLRYENGTTAVCEVANNLFIRLPRFHLSCKHGSLVIDDKGENKLIQTDYDDKVNTINHLVYTAEGPKVIPSDFPASEPREIPLPEVSGGWGDFYKNIVGVLDGTAELRVKPAQALRVLKVIEAAKQASEQGYGVKCYI